jgi:putative redox protein
MTMATKTAVTTLAGAGMRFDTVLGSGHTLVMDATEGNEGPRPAELVGAALAGCTAMDVISILRKKRQEVTHYEVRVAAVQMDGHPHAFTRFDIVHVIEGAVDPEAVRRAIELSATKYCSVGTTLASGGAELHHGYVLRDGADERYAEVLVTGPNVAPGNLAGAAG